IKPGLSLAQARADMAGVSNRIIEQHGDYPYRQFNFTVLMVPLLEQQIGDIKTALWGLMSAVGLVVLISFSNMAKLVFVGGSAREREIAVRQALGVSRRRLLRQLLTESAVLGLMGGMAGLLVGYIALRLLIRVSETSFPRVAETQMDFGVLGFTVVISLLTGI